MFADVVDCMGGEREREREREIEDGGWRREGREGRRGMQAMCNVSSSSPLPCSDRALHNCPRKYSELKDTLCHRYENKWYIIMRLLQHCQRSIRG
jgi:hypothetical protein